MTIFKQVHLCWEELTHGIMFPRAFHRSDALQALHVGEHLEPVREELVVQEPVCRAHGEEDTHAVHEFPQPK